MPRIEVSWIFFSIIMQNQERSCVNKNLFSKFKLYPKPKWVNEGYWIAVFLYSDAHDFHPHIQIEKNNKLISVKTVSKWVRMSHWIRLNCGSFLKYLDKFICIQLFRSLRI